MEGTRVTADDPKVLRRALEEAFSYRGDVTIGLEDGSDVDGYIFDLRSGATDADLVVRLVPRESSDRRSIPVGRIRSIAFTGRDPAAGKSWENWVRRYAEKKQKGERAEIESEPLD